MIIVFNFFFFFQAEDGIRDIGVTGVQTCALPILEKKTASPAIKKLEQYRVEQEEATETASKGEGDDLFIAGQHRIPRKTQVSADDICEEVQGISH